MTTDPKLAEVEQAIFKLPNYELMGLPYVKRSDVLDDLLPAIRRLLDAARKESRDELILRHRCGCEVCAHTPEVCPATASSIAMERTMLDAKDAEIANRDALLRKQISFPCHKHFDEHCSSCQSESHCVLEMEKRDALIAKRVAEALGSIVKELFEGAIVEHRGQVIKEFARDSAMRIHARIDAIRERAIPEAQLAPGEKK